MLLLFLENQCNMKVPPEFATIFLVNGKRISGFIVEFPFFVFNPAWVKIRTDKHTILINRDSIRTITFTRYVEE